jgi:hypothetical protein
MLSQEFLHIKFKPYSHNTCAHLNQHKLHFETVSETHRRAALHLLERYLRTRTRPATHVAISTHTRTHATLTLVGDIVSIVLTVAVAHASPAELIARS